MLVASTIHVAPDPDFSAPIDPPPEGDVVDLRPHSAYEALTRQLVESLGADVREIKSRLNGLIFTTIGAILLDIVIRLVER